MTFAPWNCAHGEATPVTLRVEATVNLSPADDSVDTNTVIIEGAGTILSFGDSPHIVMKRVKFVPLVLREADARVGEPEPYVPPGGGGGGATIQLVNSANLNLLSGQQRSINQIAYGMYMCPGDGTWNEVYFVQQGAALVSTLNDQISDLESRVADLEQRTKDLEEKL